VIILFCSFYGGCLFQWEEVAHFEITTTYRDLDSDGCYDAFEVLVSFKKEDGSPCHFWNVSSSIFVRSSCGVVCANSYTYALKLLTL